MRAFKCSECESNFHWKGPDKLSSDLENFNKHKKVMTKWHMYEFFILLPHYFSSFRKFDKEIWIKRDNLMSFLVISRFKLELRLGEHNSYWVQFKTISQILNKKGFFIKFICNVFGGFIFCFFLSFRVLFACSVE